MLLREKAERVDDLQKNVLAGASVSTSLRWIVDDDHGIPFSEYREMVAPYVCDVALFLDEGHKETARRSCWRGSWARSEGP